MASSSSASLSNLSAHLSKRARSRSHSVLWPRPRTTVSPTGRSGRGELVVGLVRASAPAGRGSRPCNRWPASSSIRVLGAEQDRVAEHGDRVGRGRRGGRRRRGRRCGVVAGGRAGDGRRLGVARRHSVVTAQPWSPATAVGASSAGGTAPARAARSRDSPAPTVLTATSSRPAAEAKTIGPARRRAPWRRARRRRQRREGAVADRHLDVAVAQLGGDDRQREAQHQRRVQRRAAGRSPAG